MTPDIIDKPLRITEVYRSFGVAYAEDSAGKRHALNRGTAGVDIDDLAAGQEITALHITPRNYVVRATQQEQEQ